MAVTHPPVRSRAFHRAVDGSLTPFVPHCACPYLHTLGGAKLSTVTSSATARHGDSLCSYPPSWGARETGLLGKIKDPQPMRCPGPEKLLDHVVMPAVRSDQAIKWVPAKDPFESSSWSSGYVNGARLLYWGVL